MSSSSRKAADGWVDGRTGRRLCARARAVTSHVTLRRRNRQGMQRGQSCSERSGGYGPGPVTCSAPAAPPGLPSPLTSAPHALTAFSHRPVAAYGRRSGTNRCLRVERRRGGGVTAAWRRRGGGVAAARWRQASPTPRRAPTLEGNNFEFYFTRPPDSFEVLNLVLYMINIDCCGNITDSQELLWIARWIF